VVALEIGRLSLGGPDYRWLLPEAVVMGGALLAAWRRQELLRLGPLVGLAFAFSAALVGWHAIEDVGSFDYDAGIVYPQQGNALLDGDYPRSEYPTGAVSLFALEAWLAHQPWLGDASLRSVNAVLMIPFQLLAIAAVWALRTRSSAWLAALVAFWPLNSYVWELRFDLVPAGLLAAGLALALRGWIVPSGVVLGVGTAVKWTPALAALALVVWLVASGRSRDAARHAGAAAAAFAVLTVPFLAWSPGDVLAAYTEQGGRSLTGESLFFLPLHWLGLAELGAEISSESDTPGWADPLAIAIQLGLVVAMLVAATLVRGRLAPGVAIAALTPVVFLLTNRIFSPQFLIPLTVAWAVAAALVARDRREQLAVGAAIAAAVLANAFVYPYALPWYSVTWQVSSTILFALALAVTGWLLRGALVSGSQSQAFAGRAPVYGVAEEMPGR
jgi:hypothetical protein